MTARCQGGCGKTVTEEGKWCPSCFFSESVEAGRDLQSIRLEIHAASFHLCFDPSRRAESLETLAHLVNVLQYEEHQHKKEKENL